MIFSEQLSVFIPTYMRDAELRECLDSFFEDAIRLGIRIYISNNGPSREKRAWIATYQERYSGLFYFENERNLGIDPNMMRVLELVPTEYAWMLGDDDLVLPGALNGIIERLRSSTPEFMLLNGVHFRKTVDRPHRVHMALSSDERVTSRDRVLARYCSLMPYSTLVICVARAKNLNLVPYMGTYHAYSAIPYELLAQNPGNAYGLIVTRSCVAMREGEKTWKKEVADILLVKVPRWMDALPSIFSSERDEVRRLHFEGESGWGRLIKFFAFPDIDYRLFDSVPGFMKRKIAIIRLIPFPVLKQLARFAHAWSRWKAQR